MTNTINKILSRIKAVTRRLIPATAWLFYRGSRFYCPVCDKTARKFLDQGKRRNLRCPFCLSFNRHRLDWVFFERNTDLFDGREKRMLHVAPEQCMEKRLSAIPGVDYLSADLCRPGAMVKMDITNIQYPDNYFSVIYCSHVLEHVEEDRKAIAEFYRVLAPGGWALLQVPVMAKEKSWEDPGITDPAERKRHFGHPEHLRAYGPDFVERLQQAGFEATAFRAKDILDRKERERMSISGWRWVFYCRKNAHENRS